MSLKTAWSSAVLLGIFAAPLAVQAQDQDVIRVTAAAGLERHSNLYRVSPLLAGPDFSAVYGTSQKSDTILRADFGITFDRELSLQRFQASAILNPQKFQNNSRFDHVGYSALLNWDWEISGPFSGRVGLRASNALMGFNQNRIRINGIGSIVEKNMLTRTNPYFEGRLRITPSWSLIGELEQVKVGNSAVEFLPGNNTATSVGGGLRFAPGTGTVLSFVGRSTRGKYEFLQLTDLLGQNLGAGVDNSYKQTEFLVRLNVRPSEDTLIGGMVGYQQRKFDSLNQRDFGGLVTEMNLEWRPTGALSVATALDRSIALPGVFSANYIDITRLRILPRFVLTGKTALTGAISYATWDFKGDPGIIGSPATSRKDTLLDLQVGVSYEYSRAVTLTADLRRESRSSSQLGADYSNNVLIAGIRGQF